MLVALARAALAADLWSASRGHLRRRRLKTLREIPLRRAPKTLTFPARPSKTYEKYQFVLQLFWSGENC